MNLIEETLKLVEEDDDFESEGLPSLESVVREQARLLAKNRYGSRVRGSLRNAPSSRSAYRNTLFEEGAITESAITHCALNRRQAENLSLQRQFSPLQKKVLSFFDNIEFVNEVVDSRVYRRRAVSLTRPCHLSKRRKSLRKIRVSSRLKFQLNQLKSRTKTDLGRKLSMRKGKKVRRDTRKILNNLEKSYEYRRAGVKLPK